MEKHTKSLLAIVVVAMFLVASTVASAADFVNGGFEAGNLSGWTGGGGSWFGSPALPVPPSTYVGGTPNNTVISAAMGNDPYSNLPMVYNGNYAVRVNDNINDYSVSTISQSVANYTKNDIYFQWQAVLQASHDLTDSDYFSLTLTDDTTHTNLVSRSYSSASAPGIFTNYGAVGGSWDDVYGSGWQTEHIDLAGLGAVGHDFTLTLLASDCAYGGHWGYVYLDGFAPVIQPPGPGPGGVPEPGSLAIWGALLVGLGGVSYFRRRRMNPC